MEQVVFNLEREERSTRAQNAKSFAKRAFLSGACAEMVQHQNGYCRRKGTIREGERRGIRLHDRTSPLGGKVGGKRMTPLETRHARGKAAQSLRASARTSAKLEHVVS